MPWHQYIYYLGNFIKIEDIKKFRLIIYRSEAVKRKILKAEEVPVGRDLGLSHGSRFEARTSFFLSLALTGPLGSVVSLR